MNERMQELAEQAGLLHKQIGPCVETRHMKKKEQDLEKFAELIVRECIRCCGEVDTIQKHYLKNHLDMQLGAEQCIEVIKKHFGIENE